jgi:nitrile hydratase beta subunit
MNGAHDMGGTQGFGPVLIEANEPLFHHPWERRILGLTLAMGATGSWNIDMSRRARENRSPGEYLGLSYYELWLAGLETLLVETELATDEEIKTGKPAGPAKPVKAVLTAEAVPEVLARGSPANRTVGFPPRFEVGAAVRTKVINPRTHTRIPRYARGRRGVIHAHHGAHVFPDARAHGQGDAPHHLYTVRFAAKELWGPDTTADEVFVDLWEPYLEAAT